MLAVVTAVDNANHGPGSSPQALLDGFHPAIVVSLIAAVLGVPAMSARGRTRPVEVDEPVELEAEREAA